MKMEMAKGNGDDDDDDSDDEGEGEGDVGLSLCKSRESSLQIVCQLRPRWLSRQHSLSFFLSLCVSPFALSV